MRSWPRARQFDGVVDDGGEVYVKTVVSVASAKCDYCANPWRDVDHYDFEAAVSERDFVVEGDADAFSIGRRFAHAGNVGASLSLQTPSRGGDVPGVAAESHSGFSHVFSANRYVSPTAVFTLTYRPVALATGPAVVASWLSLELSDPFNAARNYTWCCGVYGALPAGARCDRTVYATPGTWTMDTFPVLELLGGSLRGVRARMRASAVAPAGWRQEVWVDDIGLVEFDALRIVAASCVASDTSHWTPDGAAIVHCRCAFAACACRCRVRARAHDCVPVCLCAHRGEWSQDLLVVLYARMRARSDIAKAPDGFIEATHGAGAVVFDLGVDDTVIVGAIELWSVPGDAPQHVPDTFTLDSGPSSDGPWLRRLNATASPRGGAGWTRHALPLRAPQARFFLLRVAAGGGRGARLRAVRFVRPECGPRVADDGLIVWLDASSKDSFQVRQSAARAHGTRLTHFGVALQGDADQWRDVSGKFARADSRNEILAPPFAIARGTVGLPMPLATSAELEGAPGNAEFSFVPPLRGLGQVAIRIPPPPDGAPRVVHILTLDIQHLGVSAGYGRVAEASSQMNAFYGPRNVVSNYCTSGNCSAAGAPGWKSELSAGEEWVRVDLSGSLFKSQRDGAPPDFGCVRGRVRLSGGDGRRVYPLLVCVCVCVWDVCVYLFMLRSSMYVYSGACACVRCNSALIVAAAATPSTSSTSCGVRPGRPRGTSWRGRRHPRCR